MKKTFLLLTVTALTFTACVSDNDFDEYKADQEAIIADLQGQINTLTAALNANVAALQAAIDVNEQSILGNTNAINETQIAIVENLNAIIGLGEGVGNAFDELYASLEEQERILLTTIQSETDAINQAIAEANSSTIAQFAAQIEALSAQIAAANAAIHAQSLVNAESSSQVQANLEATAQDLVNQIAALEAELEGVRQAVVAEINAIFGPQLIILTASLERANTDTDRIEGLVEALANFSINLLTQEPERIGNALAGAIAVTTSNTLILPTLNTIEYDTIKAEYEEVQAALTALTAVFDDVTSDIEDLRTALTRLEDAIAAYKVVYAAL